MGDLMDGDVIFDETGKPCNVLYAHDVMFNRECYEVKFSDGATIVADAEHLWYTETKLDRTYRKNRIRKNRKMSSGVQERKEGTVKTTKEIFNTLHYCGENNHSIPVASAVQHEEKELPIPSYILGAWLGDGHSETARITNMDQEVIEKFLSYAESIGASFNIVSCNYGSKAKTYSITGGDKFQTKLSKLGVISQHGLSLSIDPSVSINPRNNSLRCSIDADK